MQITLDLNEAKIFIPTGRIMNLKDELEWNDIEITDEEMKKELVGLKNKHYELKTDFNFDARINKMMDNVENKKSRNYFYSTLTKDIELSENMKEAVTKKGQEELSEYLEVSKEALMQKQSVQDKLKKLAQLRQINGG